MVSHFGLFHSCKEQNVISHFEKKRSVYDRMTDTNYIPARVSQNLGLFLGVKVYTTPVSIQFTSMFLFTKRASISLLLLLVNELFQEKKSCMVKPKESFPVCVQIGLTCIEEPYVESLQKTECNPHCHINKHF